MKEKIGAVFDEWLKLKLDQYDMFDDANVAYKTLRKAMDLNKNSMEANACIRLFQSSLKLAKDKVIERDEPGSILLTQPT